MTTTHPAFTNHTLIWPAETLVKEAEHWTRSEWEAFEGACIDNDHHHLGHLVCFAINSERGMEALRNYLDD